MESVVTTTGLTTGKGSTDFSGAANSTITTFAVPKDRDKNLGSVNKLKPPKAPEKPLMPYMRYSRKVWDQVKASNKDSKLWEIGRIIGQMWRELPNSDKQEYIEQYEVEKEQYAVDLKAYQNSTVYQQYLTAKEKAAEQQRSRDASVESSSLSGSLKSKSATPGKDALNAKIFDTRSAAITPVDSETGFEDDPHSTRRLAGRRFYVNQRLLYDIFTGQCVPDTRGVTTEPRLKTLKRQIDSLSMHQKKLDDELHDLEAQFAEKKQRMETASDAFTKTWDELCTDAASSPGHYEQLVQRHMEKLSTDYETFKATSGAIDDNASSATSNDVTAAPGDVMDALRIAGPGDVIAPRVAAPGDVTSHVGTAVESNSINTSAPLPNSSQ